MQETSFSFLNCTARNDVIKTGNGDWGLANEDWKIVNVE